MKYLLLLILLVGCGEDEKPKPQVKYDKAMCVATCVKAMIYDMNKLSGDVVKEIRSICVAKFETVDCCESKYSSNSYYKCKEIPYKTTNRID